MLLALVLLAALVAIAGTIYELVTLPRELE
jgi:hypothetical protein